MKQQSTFLAMRTSLLLLLVGLVSIAFGFMQMYLLQQSDLNASAAGDAAHYHSMPWPISIHIVSGILFNLLAPFQFSPLVRAKFPQWHKYAGRFLLPCGAAVAFSALWMNHFYPSYGGILKYSGIVAYNIVLLGSLVLAVKMIIKGRVNEHKIWMARAIAAALGPATQRIIAIPLFIVFGEEFLSEFKIGLLIWFGLLFNLAITEWCFYRQRCSKKAICENKVATSLE